MRRLPRCLAAYVLRMRPALCRFAHLRFGAFSRNVRICQSDACGHHRTSPWTKDGDKRKMAHRHAQ
ncbi:hypothetical protein, unknown function [Leishmania braziliensis MHOM/BR/75/M2904]|uniref:Uncharacterized protein n=1 Tax=Leishmania braziliensis TaxID=5660 RepID=A4HM67_LEIBR|nr:hypothetical protein, unknown function [Leishmania braziliensis MHOM/BR/75/M2904]CAJ2480013.1 unnamed protein product [Leishmania braziliensis]CAJ2480334.1 unnamed protein product [Leishmania braziliensis]CAM43249.1 hypothetical protein, unknown function [Leishmania braziliensis MHOM/BR/75/M2904]